MIRITLASILIALTIQSTAQTESKIYSEAENIVNKYYPKSKTLKIQLQVFYNKLENCRDSSTADWLLTTQKELANVLTEELILGFDPEINNTYDEEYSIYSDLTELLPGFYFSGGEYELSVDLNYTPIIEAAAKNKTFIDDQGLSIIADALGTNHLPSSNYAYNECCDCPNISQLGSGLHSKLLIAIKGFTANSNLFTATLEEIKIDVKKDALNNPYFSLSKEAVLIELDVIKPLLELTEDEMVHFEERVQKIRISKDTDHGFSITRNGY